MSRNALWSATLLVARKELASSFRDRQTVVHAVVLPLLLYPLVVWGALQAALLARGHEQRAVARVGLASERPEELPHGLAEALERRSIAPGIAEASVERVLVERSIAPLHLEQARAWLELARRDPDPTARLDAVLWVPARVPGSTPRARLFHDGTDAASRLALARVSRRLDSYTAALRDEAALRGGRRPEELVPFEVVRGDVAPPRDLIAAGLGAVLPVLLVVLCVLGAFFPAVDLTAGERERATEDTTRLLPVPPLAVHQGKILAVCATAVLATALNLVAIAVTLGHLVATLGGGGLSQHLRALPLPALVAVLPLALLFAFFVSAVLTGLAARARSFREGQALLGPVQLAFILPALVAALPGMELSLPLAFAPVLDVALAFRGLLLGEVRPAEYALTALALLLYAVVALRLAVGVLARVEAGRPALATAGGARGR